MDAVAVAKKLNSLSARIQALRADADTEIANKIGEINGELKKIADLNAQIEITQSTGKPTAEGIGRP